MNQAPLTRSTRSHLVQNFDNWKEDGQRSRKVYTASGGHEALDLLLLLFATNPENPTGSFVFDHSVHLLAGRYIPRSLIRTNFCLIYCFCNRDMSTVPLTWREVGRTVSQNISKEQLLCSVLHLSFLSGQLELY